MDETLANKLIDKISALTEINISIIDENGKVVASRMKERIGAFHDTAFGIMKGDLDIISVDIANPETGVKEGVYMAIYANKRKTGVVGVNGDPKEVAAIAGVIKMSIEVMLEFETYKRDNMRKYTVKERLLRTIFYSDDFERADLEQYFKEMNLKEDISRIPVLIRVQESVKHAEAINKELENNRLYLKQDLMGITGEGEIFLLKSIQCDAKTMMQDYKFILGEYLAPLLKYVRRHGLEYSLYVGPIQNDIMQYRQSYLYCRWMQKNINKTGSSYFYDCIVKYLESMASQQEYNTMFLFLKKELGQKFVDNYVEIMNALIEMDYNLAKASTMLHVHKNTLVYRLDKIREILNMNPLNCNSDREFMECFYFYLNRNNASNFVLKT